VSEIENKPTDWDAILKISVTTPISLKLSLIPCAPLLAQIVVNGDPQLNFTVMQQHLI